MEIYFLYLHLELYMTATPIPNGNIFCVAVVRYRNKKETIDILVPN